MTLIHDNSKIIFLLKTFIHTVFTKDLNTLSQFNRWPFFLVSRGLRVEHFVGSGNFNFFRSSTRKRSGTRIFSGSLRPSGTRIYSGFGTQLLEHRRGLERLRALD